MTDAASTSPAPFGFDEALRLMRAGKAVRRRSWRAGMEIFLPGPNAFMQRHPQSLTPWRWTIDHASLLALDWEQAPPKEIA